MIRAKLDDTPTPKPKGPTRRGMRGVWSTAPRPARATRGGRRCSRFNTFGVAVQRLHACRARSLAFPTPAAPAGWASGRAARSGSPGRRSPAGSCQALRDHIVRFPEGAYRREAADLLTARRVTTEDVWSPSTRSLALYQPQLTEGAPDEPAAHAKALAAAQTQADNLCRGFAAATSFRFRTATPQPSSWTCAHGGGGVVCGFEGQVSCQLDEKATVEHGILRPAPHGAGRGLGTISLKRWAGEPPLGVTAEVAEDFGVG